MVPRLRDPPSSVYHPLPGTEDSPRTALSPPPCVALVLQKEDLDLAGSRGEHRRPPTPVAEAKRGCFSQPVCAPQWETRLSQWKWEFRAHSHRLKSYQQSSV